MRLQICPIMYEDAVGIGPEDVVSFKEAEKRLGLKLWNVSQLVDEGKLTLDEESARFAQTMHGYMTEQWA